MAVLSSLKTYDPTKEINEEDTTIIPWPGVLHVPQSLLKLHPSIRSKLKVRGSRTQAGFRHNLYQMMRVITKALNKLNKKKKEMMAIYLDATALVYCMSLSTIGSTPMREGLNSREYIKDLGSVAE